MGWEVFLVHGLRLMDSRGSSLILAFRDIDTYPLLMDHIAVDHEHGHEVNIFPENQSDSTEVRVAHPPSIPSLPEEHIHIAVRNSPVSVASQVQVDHSVDNSLGRSSSSSSRLQLIPRNAFFTRSSSIRQRRDSNQYNNPQRNNPLNSGWWISIELAITVSQIIASIIVLSVSQHEQPRAPLSLWVIGYSGGCVAILPLLYWRYIQRNARHQDEDAGTLSVASSSRTSGSQGTSHPGPQHARHDEDLESGPIAGQQQVATRNESRIAKHVERFKMALDCFFAVWFVVGNVWIFGGHSSADEAPNLYRLCIVFLALSCISYAMPLVICATVCCCLPCIVTLLSYREEQGQVKGALPAVIAALPIYKFKKKPTTGKSSKDEIDSDSENPGEGGIFAPGTVKERVVSGEDAVCCICLGEYKDGVDLKELQCAHFFHVECVEKWLKINATCPLCKHEVSASSADDRSG